LAINPLLIIISMSLFLLAKIHLQVGF